MDVDLLRPGTAPMSPDTFLWFEFLLDPTLLRRHLEKPTPDPSPTELIVKFLSIACCKPAPAAQDPTVGPVLVVDGELPVMPPVVSSAVNNNAAAAASPAVGGEALAKPANRRSRALKILALKVAAFLGWDLSVLESKLPAGMQSVLLRELLSELSGGGGGPPGGETPPPPPASPLSGWDPSAVPAHLLSGITIYHRWVVRSYAGSSLNAKLNNTRNNTSLQPAQSDWTPVEISEAESERSVKVLRSIVDSCRAPSTPSFDCFVPLTDEVTQVQHDWDLCVPVSSAEFNCQVLMDISNYLMFRETYPQARDTLQECLAQFNAWKRGTQATTTASRRGRYCGVTLDEITGSCIAVGVAPPHYSPSLVQQFHTSVSGQYMGINRVLDRDNVCKEIPLLYRDALELDVASEAASGKLTAHRDGMVQIQVSNMIRRALAGQPYHRPVVTPTAIHKALVPVLFSVSDLERDRLKYFLLEMMASSDSIFAWALSEQPTVKSLLTEAEIQDVMETDYTDPVPLVLTSNDAESLPTFKNPAAEMAVTERHLLSSYDPQEIKAAIVKLKSMNPAYDFAKIDMGIAMMVTLFDGICSIKDAFLQDYVYVLMIKTYDLVKMKNFDLARTMMRVVFDRVKRKYPGGVSVFDYVMPQELLVIDMAQLHAEWPAKNLDWQSVSQTCLRVLQSPNSPMVNPGVWEQCAVTLLNTGQWQPVNLPKVCLAEKALDLYACLGAACLDANKFNKKVSADLWDKLLPVFTNDQKDGWTSRHGLNWAKRVLRSVLELNALAVVVSLLANLHNALNGQPPFDLYVYSTHVWPSAVKNSGQYNVKYVSEVLYVVLDHALKYYPYNVAWLKLYGDLHFCYGHHAAALKYYLKAAIAGTDYFARPITRNVIEDHIFKRMIKCCSQLLCHTQAAVLCQFLEDVDYATAYKSLAESCCADAMDLYFDCVWDVTILEFLINLYSKRGEHYRKQRVIGIIGLLELNSNNNDEIKREAENIRKAKFLRSMAKQYVW